MQVRKLFRFSLRTFLVGVTLFAVWLAFHIRAVEKQKKAVAGILDFGGWVYYDFHFLEKLTRLRNLGLGGTKVTWRGADQWKKTLDHSVQFNGTSLKH